MYMVADGNRRGYQHMLDGFWDEARSFGLTLPTDTPVSAASFCTAREKITPELLRHSLHQVATNSLDASQRWRGRRVFAVDGMKVNLQRGDDLERAFGVPDGGYCPQVLVSVLFDVCAKAPVDLELSGFASSEREHLISMLPSLEPGDLVVLDRGYPSHEVFQELLLGGLDFLVRVPSSNSFAAIDKLRAECGSDCVVRLDPPGGSPEEWEPISLRLVRVEGPNGTETFFFTSLAATEFSRDDLRELYHMRWEVEEFYKLFKSSYIGQGQFRSKSSEGVRQEIHALVLYFAIVRVIMATAADAEGVEYDEVSQKAAVLSVAQYLTRLFLAGEGQRASDELGALLQRISRRRYKRRGGRSFPRVSHRPRLRWGPGGRHGG